MPFRTSLVLTAFLASSAHAQAPQVAALWDLPATTLARTAALETGATASFWNPAATLGSRRLRAGVQAVQTPDIIGLAGLLVGITHPINSRLGVALVFGRVEVVDLVRTSTSPAALPDGIPVYAQTAGVTIGARLGPALVGLLVRGHDSRFDFFREGGVTADVGVRVRTLARVTLAGATRFVPIQRDGETPIRGYAAAEVRGYDGTIWGSPASLFARYGILARSDGGWEHTLGTGVELASRLKVDAAYVREAGITNADWRFVMALGIRAGRYDVVAARGSGLRGIGANYRVGLEVDFER
jgi:hypothetical protein